MRTRSRDFQIEGTSKMWSWSFKIDSTDNPSVVRNRIYAFLKVEKPTSTSNQSPIRGVVSNSGFEIRRNHPFMALRCPVVAQGNVAPTKYGSVVNVTTQPEFTSLVCYGIVSVAVLALPMFSILLLGYGGPFCCTVPVLMVCVVFVWMCMFAIWAKDASLLQDELAKIVQKSVSHFDESQSGANPSTTIHGPVKVVEPFRQSDRKAEAKAEPGSGRNNVKKRYEPKSEDSSYSGV